MRQLAIILSLAVAGNAWAMGSPPGQRPTILVPDMQHRALNALRWEAPGQWLELNPLKPLSARIERMSASPGGACLRLADGTWWRATLTP